MDVLANRHAALQVLGAFLRLGLTCFGGPIAHLGYFREEFVRRRAWLDEASYAELVALCQLLPGPASSQVGFSIGLLRAGWRGGLAAWCGFTLPSAILMVLVAYGAGDLAATRVGTGLLHGLRLVAVAVVAQAVWGMARTLCPDRERASIAVLACVLALGAPSSTGQLLAIALGALAGLCWCTAGGPLPPPPPLALSRRTGVSCLVLFALLLGGLPLLGPRVALFEAFYRSGALVFGGGHVVLPLLRAAVVAPGWVPENTFLAGYGAAQAVPGPLFSFAAYLGAVAAGPLGAAVALVGIFLPGLLLVAGALPFRHAFRAWPSAQAAIAGVNAAVVGLLGAALYDPVWTGTVNTPADFALALVGFALLTAWRVPSVAVVVLGAAAGAWLA